MLGKELIEKVIASSDFRSLPWEEIKEAYQTGCLIRRPFGNTGIEYTLAIDHRKRLLFVKNDSYTSLKVVLHPEGDVLRIFWGQQNYL